MTLKEIYQALGEGKSIRHESWDKHRRICVGEYGLTFETGEHYNNDFLIPGCWIIYEEPEDLDNNISSAKYLISNHLICSELSKIPDAIESLIDLKIKKAQLK